MGMLSNLMPLTGYGYRGTSQGCFLCGSDRHEVVSTFDRRLKRLTTVICLDCGLMRSDPMPTEAELGAYYASSYRADYQFSGASGPPKHHLKRSERLAARRVARYRPLLEGRARVLELGSGSGEFMAACREIGLDGVGLEPGEDYAAHARNARGVDVRTAGWGDVDLPDKSFDVIASFHVFEHLRDPKAALDWLVTKLSDDGVVVLELPNVDRPQKPIYRIVHFAHVHGFTPHTLRALCATCGLLPDPAHQGSGAAFRKARPGEDLPPVRDPDYAARLAASVNRVNVVRDLARFTFVKDAIKRVSKDLRDRRA